LFLYMNPTLNVAYVPGSDPTSAGSSPYSNPNPKGKLRVLTPDATGVWSEVQPAFDLPQAASLAALSPAGDFAIFADAVGGTQRWEIYMVKLDSAGMPAGATAALASFEASMVFDLDVTVEGHVVVGRSAKATGGYDVISFARTAPDSWVQCPASIPFDGGPHLRVAR
jgi:hypothetical protein